MGQFGIGKAVPRTEDMRLLTGQGQYTDDLNLPGQAHAIVLRSLYAHANLSKVDVGPAMKAPGVIAIFTGADVERDGLGYLMCQIGRDDGGENDPHAVETPRPLLAVGRVRHVGDPIAFILAETVAAARDAAELIEIDYEDLPAVPTIERAIADGAPQIWDQAPGNIAFEWHVGDASATAQAFDHAHKTVQLELVNNRVVSNPIEPRAALAQYNAGEGRYVLYSGTQGSHGIRDTIADEILHIPAAQLRVITKDVGGGFGTKAFVYAEQPLALWAARKIGRPVKWTGDRMDSFQSDANGRDLLSNVALALDPEARILGLRMQTYSNLGAYVHQFGPAIQTVACAPVVGGVYDIPAIHNTVYGVLTNSVPVDAYRGAGRPEAIYMIERLIDAAARECGLTPDEIRRRNFIKPAAMPFKTAMDAIFDTGEFDTNMGQAMAAAEWESFETRRVAARARNKLRGIGMAYYVEVAGFGEETIDVKVTPDGAVEVLAGTQSTGQGHETTFAQLIEDRLGVPFGTIKIVQGDTDQVGTGMGTGGSRSLLMSGNAALMAADKIIEKGKNLAAHILEAAPEDIELVDGRFVIDGTDRAIDIFEVARQAADPQQIPDDLKDAFTQGLSASETYDQGTATYPNGCHICELEIDPETGVTQIIRYTLTDDFGKVVNPMVVAGQVHGGVAQGIGQALLEECHYDVESGQLLTSSFMDYCMPRADDMPYFDLEFNEVLCATNPLGIKGCGEAGTVGACPAIVNAVVDALKEYGVRNVDMPVTPKRLWALMQTLEMG